MNKGLQTLIAKKAEPAKKVKPKYAVIENAKFRVTVSRGNKSRFDVWHGPERLGQHQNEWLAFAHMMDAKRMLVLSDYFLRVMPCVVEETA